MKLQTRRNKWRTKFCSHEESASASNYWQLIQNREKQKHQQNRINYFHVSFVTILNFLRSNYINFCNIFRPPDVCFWQNENFMSYSGQKFLESKSINVFFVNDTQLHEFLKYCMFSWYEHRETWTAYLKLVFNGLFVSWKIIQNFRLILFCLAR